MSPNHPAGEERRNLYIYIISLFLAVLVFVAALGLSSVEVGEQRLLSGCGAWAFHRGGFCC